MKKLIFLSVVALSGVFYGYAQKIITIAKDTKVYEAPQARDEYAAQNATGEDVILKEGMSFEVKDEKSGWYIIEYTNGLRGNIMQNSIADASNIITPSPGKYVVTNLPSKSMMLSSSGEDWILASEAEKVRGKLISNVIIFFTGDGVPAYSLTILNGKPYLYSFANSVTNFL